MRNKVGFDSTPQARYSDYCKMTRKKLLLRSRKYTYIRDSAQICAIMWRLEQQCVRLGLHISLASWSHLRCEVVQSKKSLFAAWHLLVKASSVRNTCFNIDPNFGLIINIDIFRHFLSLCLKLRYMRLGWVDFPSSIKTLFELLGWCSKAHAWAHRLGSSTKRQPLELIAGLLRSTFGLLICTRRVPLISYVHSNILRAGSHGTWST